MPPSCDCKWLYERLQTYYVLCGHAVSILALPLLLCLIAWGCTQWYQTSPAFSANLYQRDPHSVNPISGVAPTEIQLIITALNDLLQRIEQTAHSTQASPPMQPMNCAARWLHSKYKPKSLL